MQVPFLLILRSFFSLLSSIFNQLAKCDIASLGDLDVSPLFCCSMKNFSKYL
nr:MAG TPA: hypothetical protein [Caudoviricetes sp.]